MGAFRDLARTEALVVTAIEAWRPTIEALGGKAPSVDEVMERIRPLAARIAPMLVDASLLVSNAVDAKKKVLFEGAQGTLLDIDHGTYPFVTSSSATSGGACTGTGVGPTRIDTVIGLCKAYCTRVGGGPFPTELDDAVGERIRKTGDEFGSVTGRPRRTGWLDMPALKYAARVNGLDGIALTKLDVLTGHDEVNVCVAYDTPHGRTTEFPFDDLAEAKPVYRTFKGWSEQLAKARTLGDLPQTARDYVKFIEDESRVPIVLVSVGYRRDETIVINNPFG
jgi:adenylosuccinate synthase